MEKAAQKLFNLAAPAREFQTWILMFDSHAVCAGNYTHKEKSKNFLPKRTDQFSGPIFELTKPLFEC